MNVLRLGLILALFNVGWAPAQAQNHVWVDIVPMTRQLLGADDATDLDNPEAVFEVVKRAAKNTKSVARSVQGLEQLEAR